MLLIIIEILLLIFMGKIIKYIQKNYNEYLIQLYMENIITEEFLELINLIKNPLYIDVRKKCEVNIFI
jgi:hypothetical protein